MPKTRFESIIFTMLMVFCLQVFFVGPFVRWVFRCIFLRGE